MLNGFWHLTWLEIKVFMREPMGVIGTLGIPVIVFLFLGRLFGTTQTLDATQASPFNVPILAALFIAIGAALSLVAIITIYREGGAAYQYFEEDTKGSITVGKQADLVILGENPLT